MQVSMKIWMVVILCLWMVQNAEYYCRSKCAGNFFSGCRSTGPTNCNSCFSTYFLSCSTTRTGMTLVDQADTSTMEGLWNISTVNPSLSCSYSSPYGSTFTYNFYNTLVGGDYMFRTVPINVPHYRLSIRFSIAYIGTWTANNDYLTMFTDDTLQTRTENISYTCARTTAATDRICSNIIMNSGTTNAFNAYDCLQNHQYTYDHNTTSMLVNFTYPNAQTNPQVRFWILFDIIFVTTNCHANCATCYGALNTQCFSCATGFFYFQNNTCLAACAGGLYLLINQLDTNTGECLASCPQGYYPSGTNCIACATNCLACTDASTCIAYNQASSQSLWRKYIVVWTVLFILAALLIFGIVWKLACASKSAGNQQLKMIPEEGRGASYQERATVHQTIQPQPFNFHIEEIDHRDNVMVDPIPRVRRRVQIDQTRATAE